jgi:hypothetical protein
VKPKKPGNVGLWPSAVKPKFGLSYSSPAAIDEVKGMRKTWERD